MKLLTNTTDIQKAIESIAKRGLKLDNDIHVAGVSVLEHVALHGDTTLLDKLVAAMPKGSRKSMFCEWACHFGCVRMLDRSDEADKAAIEQGRLFKKDKTKQHDLEGMIAMAWYNFKPEPDLLDTFDAAKMVASMMRKYNNAVKQGAKIEGGDAAITSLKALMQSLETSSAEL